MVGANRVKPTTKPDALLVDPLQITDGARGHVMQTAKRMALEAVVIRVAEYLAHIPDAKC